MPRLPPVDMSPQARLCARFISGDTYSARTCFQSQSSSSATSWARPVSVPWPISERAMRTTVVSSGPITAHMPTSLPPAEAVVCASASPVAVLPPWMLQPRAKPPPIAVTEPRNERRASAILLPMVLPLCLTGERGGGVHGLADALIGAAAADVGHRVVDIRVAGLRVGLEQRGGGHDLPRLAVAALRHVVLQPGGLHGMAESVGGQAFDRGDLRIAHSTDRHRTGAGGDPV